MKEKLMGEAMYFGEIRTRHGVTLLRFTMVQLFFRLLDGQTQIGLGHEQIPRRLTKGTCFS